MITQVHTNLFIADISGCERSGEISIIHACKHPCFISAAGKVNDTNPNYLYLETSHDLYLNIIDPELPLFHNRTFEVALRFIERHIKKRRVVIHCNCGESRSPTIAMLYLFNHLPYNEAYDKFVEIYPYYNPSYGIEQYIKTNWNAFCNF